MSCSVHYLDGRSSKSHEARLIILDDEVRVEDSSGHCLETAMLANLRLSPPLGNQDRFLKFAGGARCQINDPDTIARLHQALHSSPGLDMVHVLESSWRMVLLSSVVLTLFIWGFISFGIPTLAHYIAMAVPASIMDSLSDKTITILDKRFLADSTLPAETRLEVQALFSTVCQDFGEEARCEVLFRKGGEEIGANAFALPSGQIIVTDEFIAMAESRQEISGVLAHEMAHVRKRHSIRHALQHTGVFLMISTLVGDIGSISSMATTLPMLLVESGYSRKFEEEADRIACLYFLEQGKTTQPFQDILTRITKDEPAPNTVFSSHPETSRRVELMQKLEADYRR